MAVHFLKFLIKENEIDMSDSKFLDEILYEETQKRLGTMSRKDYEYPPGLGRLDWIIVIASLFCCLLLMALCMVGRIGE